METRARQVRGLVFGLAGLGIVGVGASMAILSWTTSSVVISTRPGELLGFEPSAASVEGAGRVSVTLRNHSNQAHNLHFVGGVSASTRTIVEAGASDTFIVELPAPGTYRFVCTIHEGMRGSLEIPVAVGQTP